MAEPDGYIVMLKIHIKEPFLLSLNRQRGFEDLMFRLPDALAGHPYEILDAHATSAPIQRVGWRNG